MSKPKVFWDVAIAPSDDLFKPFGGRTRFETGILRALYKEHRSVRIRPLAQGLGGAAIFLVALTDGRSAKAARVLKIGDQRILKVPAKNSQRYGSAVVGSAPHVHREVELCGFLVREYQYKEGQTLADRIAACARTDNVSAAESILKNVFDALKNFSRAATSAVHPEYIGVKQYRLSRRHFRAFDQSRHQFSENWAEPFNSLRMAQRDWTKVVRDISTSLRHGDLHANNVLIDNNDLPAILDFDLARNTHHILKDVLTLEADIVLRVLTPATAPAVTEARVLRSLYGHIYSTQHFVLGEWPAHLRTSLRAQFTHKIVRAIRERAMSLMNGDEEFVVDYLFGILRFAVSRAGRPAHGLSSYQRWQAGHLANHLETVLFRANLWPSAPCRDEMRTVERASERSVRMGSNHFIDKFKTQLEDLRVFTSRTEKNVPLKAAIADYFLKLFWGRLDLNGITRFFLESGSSIAFLAERFATLLGPHATKATTIHIETNNIFACLEFQLGTRARVILYPPGPPDPTYGATFGALLYKTPRMGPPTHERVLDKVSRQELELVKAHLITGYRRKGIILMSASGMDFVVGKWFRGPHVGSYENMLFKRAILESECPTVMFMDEDKMPYGFTHGSCFPICDSEFPWESACERVPMAVAVAFRTKQNSGKCIANLRRLGFKPRYRGRDQDEPWPLIVTNDKFEQVLPER